MTDRVLLADHVDLLTGFPFKSADYSQDSDDVRLLRGDNVVQGALRWDNAARWSRRQISDVTRYELRPGDVVLAMDRPWIEAGLKYARIGDLDVPSLLVQRVARLRARADVDQGFLFYLIGSRAFTDHVLAVQTGTAVPHISGKQILSFEFALPPIDEQRAIAAVLGALDQKIEQNRRTVKALERLARATFKAWFVDFEPIKAKAAGTTSFPGMPPAVFAALPDRLTESSLGPVPEGWNVVEVYDLAKVVYGAPFASKLFNNTGAGKPLIRIRDLQTHSPSVSTTERHAKGTLIQPGEIVVGMDGEFRLHYWTGPDAWLNQRLCSFQPLPSVPAMYLGEALRAPLAYVERSEAATTVIHLGKYDIDRFELLRPDKDTLSAFDSITAPMLRLILHMASESSRLAALRDYLLPRLLSGAVRVRPPQAEAEG